MSEIQITGTGNDLTPVLSQFLQRLLNYTVLNPTGVPGPANVDPIVPLTVALYNDPTPAGSGFQTEDLGELICYFDVYVDRATAEADTRCGQRVTELCKVVEESDGSKVFSLVGEFTSTQGVGTINKVRILGGPWMARKYRTSYDLRSTMPIHNCFIKSELKHDNAARPGDINYYFTYGSVLLNAHSDIRDDWVISPESYEFGKGDATRIMRLEFNPGLNTASLGAGLALPNKSINITHNEGVNSIDHPYAFRTRLSKDIDIYLFQSYTSLQDIAISRYLASEDYSTRANFTLNLPSPLLSQRTFGVWLDEADVLNVVCTFANMTTYVSHLTYALTDLTTPTSRRDIPVGEDISALDRIAIYDKLDYDEDDPNIAYLFSRNFIAGTHTYSSDNYTQDNNYSTYHASQLTLDGSLRARWLGLVATGRTYATTEVQPWNCGLRNVWMGRNGIARGLDGGYQFNDTGLSTKTQTMQHYDHKRKHVRTIDGYYGHGYTHAFVPAVHAAPIIAEAVVEEVVKTDQMPLRVSFNLKINTVVEEEVV